MAEQTITAAVPQSGAATAEWDERARVTSPDMHLVELAKCGDEAAFSILLNRYRDRAVRLAAHVMRRPIEAEDAVQEAFLRAFAQIGSFRSNCSFYTWFYRIVVRVCLNRMRTPEWRYRAEADLHREGGSMAAAIPGPSETRTVVDALLDELSPPLRAVLVLRENIGLEYEEIAEALEIPVGTVRSRLSAARVQFRAMWMRVQEETNNV